MHQLTMNRRDLLKVVGVGVLGAMLPACGAPMSRSRLIRTERRFAIPKISWDRVIRTVVGLRPCREAFFRVETERLGEKIVIHNYGHCARGVGLSWGTSHLAVEEALRTGQTRYAVLGCGAVGLATGRLLQRQGFAVTIYAKDLPPNTTSNVAAAMFDPAPLPGELPPDLTETVVRAARLSHRYFQDMVGDYYGVRWLEYYGRESDEYRDERERNVLADLYHYRVLSREEHPFGNFEVLRGTTMQIQTPIYLNAVMRDFRLAGGRIVVRDFADLEAVLALPEPVIMNCTGLGAKALFGDEEMYPIKGQLTILLPQPEIDYAGFGMTPRNDGLLTGGLAEPGVWTLEPNEEEVRRRLNRTIEFWSGVESL